MAYMTDIHILPPKEEKKIFENCLLVYNLVKDRYFTACFDDHILISAASCIVSPPGTLILLCDINRIFKSSYLTYSADL